MATKVCSRCGLDLPHARFSRRGDGLQPFCKGCNRAYQREHYRANVGAYKRRARAYARRQRSGVRAWVWAHLEAAGCADCGVRDPRVLDFDHRDPAEKAFAISQALNGSYTLERVQAEAAKCDVRCANCHRIRTARQQGWYGWRER